MKEIILCKYGELILKGANKRYFEDILCKELRRRASPYGNFKIYFKQSTIYVEPQNDFCDMDGMYEAARRVFGIVGVNRAAVCEKNMDSIIYCQEGVYIFRKEDKYGHYKSRRIWSGNKRQKPFGARLQC